jgi:hypothetical protein
MFNILIVVVMLALAAFYSVDRPQTLAVAAHSRSQAQALEMAAYRSAVVDYFSVHPEQLNSVAPQAQLLAPDAPTAVANNGAWGNYRGADGTIVVYPLAAPAPGLLNELLLLSKNSGLVGSYNNGFFQSTLSGPTGIALPILAQAIPQGSPVWLAGGY